MTLPPQERFGCVVWVAVKPSVTATTVAGSYAEAVRILEDVCQAIAITLDRNDIVRADTDQQDILIAEALAAQRSLLVIDNLETVDEELLYQVPLFVVDDGDTLPMF